MSNFKVVCLFIQLKYVFCGAQLDVKSRSILQSSRDARVNEKHMFYQDTTPMEIQKGQKIQTLPDRHV